MTLPAEANTFSFGRASGLQREVPLRNTEVQREGRGKRTQIAETIAFFGGERVGFISIIFRFARTAFLERCLITYFCDLSRDAPLERQWSITPMISGG